MLLQYISVQDAVGSYLHDQSSLLLAAVHLLWTLIFSATQVIFPKTKSDKNLLSHPISVSYVHTALNVFLSLLGWWLDSLMWLTRPWVGWSCLHLSLHTCHTSLLPPLSVHLLYQSPVDPLLAVLLSPQGLCTFPSLYLNHSAFLSFPVNVFSSCSPQFLCHLLREAFLDWLPWWFS